jgi:hypothetical protein
MSLTYTVNQALTYCTRKDAAENVYIYRKAGMFGWSANPNYEGLTVAHLFRSRDNDGHDIFCRDEQFIEPLLAALTLNGTEYVENRKRDYIRRARAKDRNELTYALSELDSVIRQTGGNAYRLEKQMERAIYLNRLAKMRK